MKKIMLMPPPAVSAALLLAALSPWARGASLRGEHCAPLSADISARLSTWVASKYELAPDVTVDDEGLVGQTCFRRVSFHSASPARVLTLYLSPDQQFLTSELFDLAVDPAAERIRVARATQLALLADPSPVEGPENAPVTLVVFSDFECPFCARLNEVIQSLGVDQQSVRIVFKQFPLTIHPWAHEAALATTCAGFQGNTAFWRMHDFLFLQQESLTKEAFDERLKEYVRGSGQLSIPQFQACLHSDQAEAVLRRDAQLAETYHVTGTPAVFVNGMRKPPFQTKEALQNAIEQASRIRRSAQSGGSF